MLSEPQVRAMVSMSEAIAAVREAFVRLHRGEAAVPRAIELLLPHNGGELHAKGAFIAGSRFLTIKVATGFPMNREKELPESGGLSVVFDADTGFPAMLLFDNGYLTQLRTGAAGALAADLLARPAARTVAIIGAGVQARFQLAALVQVRPIERVLVASKSAERAERYAAEVHDTHGLEVEIVGSPGQAASAADIVVTTTPSTEPLLGPDDVGPGTHITAMGSDFHGKQELASELIGRADIVVADQFYDGKAEGELAAALADGAIRLGDIRTLGAIAAGDTPGRTTDAQISVADLTGVGVQDAAVAALVAERALRERVGLAIDPATGALGEQS